MMLVLSFSNPLELIETGDVQNSTVELYICIYIYIYVCVCVCVCMCIYMYNSVIISEHCISLACN
jgi:hypothetical protein